jgi:hypothetical protein
MRKNPGMRRLNGTATTTSAKATGSQWNHETLYKSRKGRYYVEHSSQWQGSRPHGEWVSPEAATRWLILNNHELPDELQKYEDEVSE